MKYQVMVEYDPEGKYYTATVPGLPIVVESTSERGALKLAREAIAFHRESQAATGTPTRNPDHTVRAKLVTVNV